MNIVPPPRSSYVRVRLLGAPPDSYFDFLALSFHTPRNGSRDRVTAAAGRDGAVVAFGAGRDGLCWAAVSPDDRVIDVASRSINGRRESRIRSLQSWEHWQRSLNVRTAQTRFFPV